MPARQIVRQKLLATVLLLAVTAGLAGCQRLRGGSQPDATVPVQPSAEAQLAYAYNYRDMRHLELIADQQRFENAREVVRQTFQRVIDYYPEDLKATPLAKLEVLEMEAGLDFQKAQVTPSQRRAVIGKLRSLREEYPSYEYLQAKAQYDIGLILKSQGKFPEMQQEFGALIEQYGNSPDPVIQDIVKRAQLYYSKVYVNE